ARVEAPPKEPKAFVVQGGKGVAEREFDTLAEAVVGTSDGDTIEIRGNGPFECGFLKIGNVRLTIRAGPGFRPVLRWVAPAPGQKVLHLIQAEWPLVLEGLEIDNSRPNGVPLPGNFLEIGHSLHATNCAFRLPAGTGAFWTTGGTKRCVLRNC